MAQEGSSFRAKVVKSFLWLGTGTFVGQFISWLSTILVIRLLLPSDYGLMAMAASVVTLLTMLSELGVGSAVIQAAHVTDEDLRRIFGFVLASSAAGALICFASAPAIALFYHEPRLVLLIRALSANFLIMALYVIPQALYVREMDFRTKAAVDMSAQIAAALLTLLLAWQGRGVWSLVAGQVVMHAVKAVWFNIARRAWWKPLFAWRGAETFIRYGLTLTGDRLFFYLFTISDTVIAGKFLGDSLLGIYAIALNLASIPAEKVLPIITQVSFTSYSRIQDDLDRIRRGVLGAAGVIALAGFPVFFGMAGVAPEAIPLILGQKWVSIIVPFQLICLVLPLKAISPILPPAVFAIGRPRTNMENMIITFLLMSCAFLIGVRGGITGMALAWLAAYPVVFVITAKRCLRIMQIPAREFFGELKFPFAASSLMLCSLLLVKRMAGVLPPLPALALLIAAGGGLYAGAVLLFRRSDYLKLKSFILQK